MVLIKQKISLKYEIVKQDCSMSSSGYFYNLLPSLSKKGSELKWNPSRITNIFRTSSFSGAVQIINYQYLIYYLPLTSEWTLEQCYVMELILLRKLEKFKILWAVKFNNTEWPFNDTLLREITPNGHLIQISPKLAVNHSINWIVSRNSKSGWRFVLEKLG